MFIRFRRQARRLQVSLIETRRVAGKVLAEHIGALGSVDANVSVRDRLAFWAKLPQRLASLGNRISPDDHPKLYAAVHARIPMVTPDEQRAVQAENAKDDERFWAAMHDIGCSNIEGHKGLIATAEMAITEETLRVTAAAERAEGARKRVAGLARGESVSGGLGQKLDVSAMMRAQGFTPRQMKRRQLQASLTGEEFETVLERTNPAGAVDKAFDRELRRLMRQRQP